MVGEIIYSLIGFSQHKGRLPNFRRERINAFRPGRKSPWFIESKNVVFCVGNGFIRSERLMNIRGSLNGEWSVHTLGNGLAHSVGEAAFADVFIINLAGYSDNLALCQIIGCGNSASRSERINPFPTKRINIFPFNAPTQNHSLRIVR